MTPEQILKIPARVLTKQREDYFTNGYILLEKFISDDW
ncbi:MAG: phytanoyl-CoA dioxygenase family protein, partial [Burkholderiaceae bacterium]|nr:phytanoyl-CoA dioxygenase family protein [Burkholderiaceae bacterium]